MDTSLLLSLLEPEAKNIDMVMHDDMQTLEDGLLSDVLRHSLFNGGKRIRPLLCVFAARLCGCNVEEVYRLAIAFEYLHVATLLHDDVIDHGNTRRGKQTVNALWGNTPAILAGDYLHARSMFLIGKLGGEKCLEIICQATNAMVAGEFLQLRNAGDLSTSEKDYFEIIEKKTAVLIAAVCEIGSVYAGADAKQQEALRMYGNALGKAFQVVDDLLDYLGDSSQTGKVVGNDFVEGKMTLPLIHTLKNAKGQDRDFIQSLLDDSGHVRQQHVTAVRQLIERYNGFGYAKEKAKRLIDIGLDQLKLFDKASSTETFSILTGLANYVLTREK